MQIAYVRMVPEDWYSQWDAPTWLPDWPCVDPATDKKVRVVKSSLEPGRHS